MLLFGLGKYNCRCFVGFLKKFLKSNFFEPHISEFCFYVSKLCYHVFKFYVSVLRYHSFKFCAFEPYVSKPYFFNSYLVDFLHFFDSNSALPNLCLRNIYLVTLVLGRVLKQSNLWIYKNNICSIKFGCRAKKSK